MLKKSITLAAMMFGLGVAAFAQPAVGLQPSSAEPYWNISSSGTYYLSVVAAPTGWPDSNVYHITSFSVSGLPANCSAGQPVDYIGTKYITITCNSVPAGTYNYSVYACDDSWSSGRCTGKSWAISST